jgi:flagellin-specific chaperone FliS
MAYERIIAACDRATLAHLTPGNSWLQIFHDETVRAQAILTELASVLAVGHPNPAVDEMAKSLDGIYAFASQQLATANVEKSAEPLRSVRRMIDGLRDAWVTAS